MRGEENKTTLPVVLFQLSFLSKKLFKITFDKLEGSEFNIFDKCGCASLFILTKSVYCDKIILDECPRKVNTSIG